ncbi:MAG TPA: shikimate kinase [Planctomycetaceae bacterium]|nr:shikimate kinase [Planctomycetaceae bacterium]
MKSISLIGYRCTGKTTVARLLAERLGLRAVDSDPLIERRCGKPIAAIFAEDGEATFRNLEERMVAELLDGEPVVLSPGGGAILRESTRSRLRNASTVVWLTAEVEMIAARMNADATTAARRPSLTGRSPTEEIRTVLESREPFYRETAHFTVATDGKTPGEIVEEILMRIMENTENARCAQNAERKP